MRRSRKRGLQNRCLVGRASSTAIQRYHTFPRQHRNSDMQAVSAIADIFRRWNYAPVNTHLNLSDVVIISGSKASCMTGSPPRSALHREGSELRRARDSRFIGCRRWPSPSYRRAGHMITGRPLLLTKDRLQPSPTFLELFHTGIMAKQRCSVS
jgi:hypothetical protein